MPSGLNYIKLPRSVTEYTLMKGVTDFSNLKQYDLFETGYSFLTVVGVPDFMNTLASKDSTLKNLQDGFVHILEGEFRGLNGIPDITAGAGEINNGFNNLQLINNVEMDTSIQVEMSFWERSGGLITNYLNYYLTGIKDPYSKAKTYHGLIGMNGESGDVYTNPGPQHEVFTFLYYVTDNTMRKVEKAYLLANAQPTAAPNGTLYNTTRGTMEFPEISITFNCFPIMGDQINKYAAMMLQNDISADISNNRRIVLDFNDYEWAVMRGGYKQSDTDSGNTYTYRKDGIVENTGLVKDILGSSSIAAAVDTHYEAGEHMGTTQTSI